VIINQKTIKTITETKYLSTENASRYRAIMRIFYEKSQIAEFLLYKEEIYNIMKENFTDYTLELCDYDLEQLKLWGNIEYSQDTKSALTIEEFKNKKYRYAITDYGIEIERFVKRLENLHVESGSLEPKLFDKICEILSILPIITSKDEEDISSWWDDLNNSFNKLSTNYQDFLRQNNEAKIEELLKSDSFIIYKNKVKSFLSEFIKSFQNSAYKIENILKEVTSEDKKYIVDVLHNHRKRTVINDSEFDFPYYDEINSGKLESIISWFIGSNEKPAEGRNLTYASNNIINKLLKYADSIFDFKTSSAIRKDEYKYIAKLFSQVKDIDEAHQLSASIIGVSEIESFSHIEKSTDGVNVSPYELIPNILDLKVRNRNQKQETKRIAIKDKTHQKQIQYAKYLEELEAEKQILKKLISNKKIIVNNLTNLKTIERRFILKLITNYNYLKDLRYIKDNEYNITYNIEFSEDKFDLICEDGILEMFCCTINIGD